MVTIDIYSCRDCSCADFDIAWRSVAWVHAFRWLVFTRIYNPFLFGGDAVFRDPDVDVWHRELLWEVR